MGRLSKEEQARFSGANWMYDFIEKHGIEEGRKELEIRGIRNMPLKLKDSDVDVFVNTERTNIMNCLLLDTLLTLHDVFDFEKDECKKFIERWNDNVSCIADHYVKWREIRDIVYEEIGIWINLSKELEEGEQN